MDIVFQHMTAMGDFIKDRSKIVEFLFLPLDSQIFQSDFVFSDSEITKFRINRNFTFTSIKTKAQYKNIQDFLKEKADKIGINHRIYFDLIWNDRYKSDGKNLFETNPK